MKSARGGDVELSGLSLCWLRWSSRVIINILSPFVIPDPLETRSRGVRGARLQPAARRRMPDLARAPRSDQPNDIRR